MLHLFTFLTFELINNVLYFLLNLGGGDIEIFFIPYPYTKKFVLGGGYKNDITKMFHLFTFLTFQSINNALYFFYWGYHVDIEPFYLT